MTPSSDDEKRQESFFVTYPRFLPFVLSCLLIISIIVCIMLYVNSGSSRTKSDAEIEYEQEVWKTKAAQQQIAQEEFNRQAAEIAADAAIIKAEAEAAANSKIADSLTPELIEYYQTQNSEKQPMEEVISEDSSGIQH